LIDWGDGSPTQYAALGLSHHRYKDGDQPSSLYPTTVTATVFGPDGWSNQLVELSDSSFDQLRKSNRR